MSERKKLKAEKGVNKAKKLYEILRLTQTPPNGFPIREHAEYLIGTLSIPCARSYGIMALAELIRISGSVNILTPVELVMLFEALYQVIAAEDIALDTFIDLRIPSYMKNTRLILKFFELIQRTDIRNREHLRRMLIIFIEENEDRGEYLKIIIHNSKVCKDLIESIHKYIDITALEEDEYLRLFCENECVRTARNFRVVKGRKRLYFVQKAIDSHYQSVMENYIKDKDKRVRLVLAERVTMDDEKFFRILLNDHDEDIRLTIVRRIRWSPDLLDISERLLDKSYNVRREMIRIYREGLFRLRQLPIFKKALLKVGRLNFDGNSDCELSKDYGIFVNFVYRLFEGCLTTFKDEYIQVIKESSFTLDFLAEYQDCPGAHFLFSTMEITSYSEVPEGLRSFCLRHLYKGCLSDKEIMDALEDNIFAVIKFIKDFPTFFDMLLYKAMTINDLEAVETIVESIKNLLSKKAMLTSTKYTGDICDASNINGTIATNPIDPTKEINPSALSEFSSPNLYFINAHTKCEKAFIEQQYGKETYHHLYFIVHQSRNDSRIPLCLKNSTLSMDKKIRLLIYLDNPDILADFSDLLIKHSLEFALQNDLLSRKTLTASLIYFLCTGLVSVKSPSFFIRCIKSTLNCNSTEKVKWIFERYIGAVDQKTFDVFYSICWDLKGCTTLKTHNETAGIVVDSLMQDNSIILNPKISANNDFDEANGSPKAQSLASPVPETTTNIAPFIDLSEAISSQDINHGFNNHQGLCQNAVENKVHSRNELPSVNSLMDNCKLKLTKADKMLHFICNFVTGSRKGTFTELSTDLAKYGFFKMSESHIEMVGCGQVLYE